MTRKRTTPSMSLAERVAFYSRPSESGCILWTAQRKKSGYGQLTVNGMPRAAHRLAWELRHGPIPFGMLVCHKCDNPPCCNPDHLFLGTHKDNSDDKITKGRLRTGRLPGELHGQAKLTTEQVLAIRADARPQRTIAAAYGISQGLVSHVRLRKAWRHLDG